MLVFRILTRATVIAGAGLLAGCASFPSYARSRALDASDMVRGHLMAGLGFDAKLEATRFVALGIGFYDAYAIGLADRYFGTWHERIYDFAPLLGMNHHDESVLRAAEVSVSGDYEFQLGNLFPTSRPERVYTATAPRGMDWFTLRATAFLFVGVDVELRLGEVIDFVAGIFGGDPSGDDGTWPPPVADAKDSK